MKMAIRPCDNISNVHENFMMNEEPDGVRYICDHCKQQNVLRIGLDGRMENRLYTRVFKKDVLQPHDNLYFRVHPDEMSLA